MSTITSPLGESEKTAAGAALNRALVDLVDLSLVAEQAHWNVVGEGFRSLHLDLDEVVDQTRLFADHVAERAVTLGISPDGRAATVARSSAVPEHPVDRVQDVDVVEYFVSAPTVVIGRLRQCIA
jgi:starvation-inducible DNA-binding protein